MSSPITTAGNRAKHGPCLPFRVFDLLSLMDAIIMFQTSKIFFKNVVLTYNFWLILNGRKWFALNSALSGEPSTEKETEVGERNGGTQESG